MSLIEYLDSEWPLVLAAMYLSPLLFGFLGHAALRSFPAHIREIPDPWAERLLWAGLISILVVGGGAGIALALGESVEDSTTLFWLLAVLFVGPFHGLIFLAGRLLLPRPWARWLETLAVRTSIVCGGLGMSALVCGGIAGICYTIVRVIAERGWPYLPL